MRSMVEGHTRLIATPMGPDISPVPLHHPAGGPPPRSGEELSYPFSAAAIVSLIGVVGRPDSVLRSLLSL
jgi:hypothetical protein